MLGQSAAAIALACSTWAVAAQASTLGRSADGGATDLSSFAATLAIALAVVPLALACCRGGQQTLAAPHERPAGRRNRAVPEQGTGANNHDRLAFRIDPAQARFHFGTICVVQHRVAGARH